MKELWGNVCCYCGVKAEKLTKEHLYPKSKGGSSSWDNIAPACDSCNSRRMAKPIWEMLK